MVGEGEVVEGGERVEGGLVGGRGVEWEAAPVEVVIVVEPRVHLPAEVDREERIHSLTLATYGQGGVGAWVLLEPVSE